MKVIQLLEATSRPLIIVDVQPAYSNWITFDVSELMNLVNNHKGKVLVLMNDSEESGLTDDSTSDIIDYYLNHGLSEEKIDNLEFINKGFGYLRSWIDYPSAISLNKIIKVIRELYKRNLSDSRDLLEDDLKQIMGEDFGDWMIDDPIFVNWLSIKKLREYINSYICGGGKDECLKEVLILMNAFNIKYKILSRFVY